MGELVQMASFRSRDGVVREPFVTKRELCELLRISSSCIQRKMQAEKKRPGTGIPFHKLGDSDAAPVRFRVSEVMEALERGSNRAA